MQFLKDFKKNVAKMDDVTFDNSAPDIWYSTGSYALNRILSGSFTRGIAMGRVSCFAAVSGGGKSYICSNILREAQNMGAFTLVIDTENALSEDFLRPIGVQLDDPGKFSYVGVSNIETVTAVLSEFLTGYEKEYGRNKSGPPVLILLDSLDMLISNAESDKFERGVQTSDMGTRTRLFKHLLRTVCNRISKLNVGFVLTHQVYLNQDMQNGLGEFIVNNAVRYSASAIATFKPLKLREGTEIKGIRIKAETYKSRFARIGHKIEIEVPWDTGMDKFSGVMDMLVEMGVITQGGAWYTLQLPDADPIKFQRKNLGDELWEKIMTHPIIVEEERLFASVDSVPEPIIDPVDE